MYGQERLIESLLKYSHLSGREIVENIIKDALSKTDLQDDDITLVLLRKV